MAPGGRRLRLRQQASGQVLRQVRQGYPPAPGAVTGSLGRAGRSHLVGRRGSGALRSRVGSNGVRGSDVPNMAYDAAGGPSRDRVEAEWVYKDVERQEVFRLIGLESHGGRRRCRAAHVVPDGWGAVEGEGPLPPYRLDQLPDKQEGEGDEGVVFVRGGEVSADDSLLPCQLPEATAPKQLSLCIRRRLSAAPPSRGGPCAGTPAARRPAGTRRRRPGGAHPHRSAVRPPPVASRSAPR
jgi:hypothetical protein